MPIRIRHLKNQRRGTEVTYATIPIDEARNIGKEEVRKTGEEYYGNHADYVDLTKQIRDFSNEGSVTEMTVPINIDKKRFKTGLDPYISLKKVGQRVMITPSPVIHDIMAHGEKEKRFSSVIKILKNGFGGKDVSLGGDSNSFVKNRKNHRYNMWGVESAERDITFGDRYSLEILPEEGSTWDKKGYSGIAYLYEMTRAKPENVTSVNIQLSPSISQKVKEAKIEFYQEQIAGRYSIPVRFFETSGRFENYTAMNGKTYQKVIDFQTLGRIFPKEKSLEQKVSGTTAFIALFGGVFFFSTKITANVVGVSPQASSLIGAGLLTVGLIAGFFWVRKSKGL